MYNKRVPNQVDLAKVKEFLSDHRLATISTASANGQPHGAAIYIWADDELNFYFVTQTNTRKHDFAFVQSQVALTITDAEAQLTLQIEGDTQLVEDIETGKLVARGLADAPARSIPHWPPPVSKMGNDIAIVRIIPTWMRLADFSKSNVDNPSGYFTQILP